MDKTYTIKQREGIFQTYESCNSCNDCALEKEYRQLQFVDSVDVPEKYKDRQRKARAHRSEAVQERESTRARANGCEHKKTCHQCTYSDQNVPCCHSLFC